jgi:hypothetical protein
MGYFGLPTGCILLPVMKSISTWSALFKTVKSYEEETKIINCGSAEIINRISIFGYSEHIRNDPT